MDMKKLAAMVVVALGMSGCASMKPVIRSVNDRAREACEFFFASQQGSSIDRAREVCAIREVLDPFLREILAAEQAAGEQAAPIAARQGK
jgi:hypothetical protein